MGKVLLLLLFTSFNLFGACTTHLIDRVNYAELPALDRTFKWDTIADTSYANGIDHFLIPITEEQANDRDSKFYYDRVIRREMDRIGYCVREVRTQQQGDKTVALFKIYIPRRVFYQTQ